MRHVFWAFLALALTFSPAMGQAPVAARWEARGLEAQFRAALIRERRLADERELRLIADSEGRMRAARRQLAQVRGDRTQAQTALDAARDDYARLVEAVPLHEAGLRVEVEAFRAEVEGRLPQATPEMLAAYQEFADGDRAAAWSTLEPLLRARANARVAAARAVAAGEVRQLAQLRGIMRENGEATTRDVLALWRQAAELDPSDFMTAIQIARDLRELGDTDGSLVSLQRATSLARTSQHVEILTNEVRRSQIEVRGAASVDRSGDVTAARTRLAASPDSVAAKTALANALTGAPDRTPQMLEEAERLAREAFAADSEAGRSTLALTLASRAYAIEGAQGAALAREALEIARAATPMNTRARDVLATVFATNGDLSESAGDYARATLFFLEGVILRRQNWTDDPTIDNLIALSRLTTKLGFNFERVNDPEEALGVYGDMLRYFDQSGVTTRAAIEERISLHTAIARTHIFSGTDADAAQQNLARARELIATLQRNASAGVDAGLASHLGPVELLAAEIAARRGDAEGAVAAARLAHQAQPDWADASARLVEWSFQVLTAETDTARQIALSTEMIEVMGRLERAQPAFARLYPYAAVGAAGASDVLANAAVRRANAVDAQRHYADVARFLDLAAPHLPEAMRPPLVDVRINSRYEVGRMGVFRSGGADRSQSLRALQQLIDELTPAIPRRGQLQASRRVSVLISAHILSACMDEDQRVSQRRMADRLIARVSNPDALEESASRYHRMLTRGDVSASRFDLFCLA